MAIDIAAMDATQKLAFAQAVGSIKLAGGSISSPVSHIDIALPSGYETFIFELRAFKTSLAGFNGIIAFALSADDGATFLNDTVNFVSYISSGSYTNPQIASGIFSAGTVANNSGTDSLGYIDEQAAAEFRSSTWHLYPGDADKPAALYGQAQSVLRTDANNLSANWTAASVIFNADPVTYNLIRIKPYDDGFAAPGTGTILSGSYTVIGVI